MNNAPHQRRAAKEATAGWLPWWCRPSLMLLGASLPALLIFSYSDSRLTLAKAQLFYGQRDLVVGLVAIGALVAGALLGESRLLPRLAERLRRRIGGRDRVQDGPRLPGPRPRLAESLLSPKLDLVLMVVFVVSHLIFFRGFFLNPGLAAGVLGGNLELKHTFKTIPGVTTWTQVTLVLGALRGLRWAGILPGQVKLISWFHLVFFGTLFVRALLWSERLALIEGAVPFFLCALPRITRQLGRGWRPVISLLPLLLPAMVLLIFVAFEALRSWQYYSGQHSNIFEFGWRRLYTYYFEAMNTGAAVLGMTDFYRGVSGPVSKDDYEALYEGLYLGILDLEYNNVSGIWYIAARVGSVLFVPVFLAVGLWWGSTYRSFATGRLFGLFYPMTFLGLMEILRIPYWFGLNRALPSSLVIFLVLAWAASLAWRVRPARRPAATAGDPPPACDASPLFGGSPFGRVGKP